MKNNSNEFDGLTMKPLVSDHKVRAGWSNGAQAVAKDSFDDLLFDEFSNLDDHKFEW